MKYLVVWSDEDGMEYDIYPTLSQAKKRLRELFEMVAPDEYREENLEYYADEWEPDNRDPFSEENEHGWEMAGRYYKVRNMSLEEDDIALTEDYLYYREESRDMPSAMDRLFNARIIPMSETA